MSGNHRARRPWTYSSGVGRSDAEHGRVVHDIGNGRSIAFDATIRDPDVDKIFDPVIEQVTGDAARTNKQVRERIRKTRSRQRAAG
jgi:hypothetical protein